MPDPNVAIHPQTIVRTVPHFGLPVREDVAFTNAKGEESKSVQKACLKLLEKLQGILQPALQQNEVILYALRGNRPAGAFEQFTLGWIAQTMMGVVLVFTTRRLLVFRVQPGGAWRGSLRTVAWGDVETAKAGGWLTRTLDLKCRDGGKEKYWGFRFGDAGKLKLILPTLLGAARGEMTPAGKITSLCPKCRTVLTPGVYQCAACQQEFRNEQTLLWRTIFIPGGGYFYTKYPLVGVLSMIGESFLLIGLAVLLAEAAGLIPLTPTAEDPNPTREGSAIGAAFVAGLLALETLITFVHGRKLVREFIPIG